MVEPVCAVQPLGQHFRSNLISFSKPYEARIYVYISIHLMYILRLIFTQLDV